MTRIGESDSIWLRPGGGLAPDMESRVIGKELKWAASAGEMLLPERLG